MGSDGVEMIEFHVFGIFSLVFVEHFSSACSVPTWHCRERIVIRSSSMSTRGVELCKLRACIVYWWCGRRLVALIWRGLEAVLGRILVFGFTRPTTTGGWTAGVTAGETGTTAFGAAAETSCDAEDDGGYYKGGDYYCYDDRPPKQRLATSFLFRPDA